MAQIRSPINLVEIIKLSPVVVHKCRYACLKTNEERIKDPFLICKDKDETIIITEEKNIKNTRYEKSEKWFKLFEIKVNLPFQAVGFLAKITKTIAEKRISVLVISTFSKDYILIKEEKYKTAVKALEEIGFSVQID